MTDPSATSPHNRGDSPSIDEFVDGLIGVDVDAPELKAQLARLASPILDVITGNKSGIAHLVEESGVDERSVIDVLTALQCMPMPNVVAGWLRQVGFAQDDVPKIDIGIKRVAMALVGQHVGLLPRSNQGPREPDASS